MPTVRVSSETMALMESWRDRVLKQKGIPFLSWDQFLAWYANSKVVP